MRIGSLVLAATVVCAAVGGASAATSASTDATVSAARSPGYNFKARVQLNVVVKWREDIGSPSTPCSEWRQSVGQSWMYVKGASVPGHFQLQHVGPSRTQPWATIVAVGGKADPASYTRRRLIEAGGSNWGPTCSGPRPAPFVPPPNDCDKPGTGRTSARDFQGQVVIRAARRKALATLDDVTSPDDEGRFRAIVVDGAPLRGWYRRCRVSRLAPDPPANFAAFVDDQDIAALRSLKPNQRYSFRYASGTLSCVPPDEMSDGEQCSGSFSIDVDLRRIGTRERFP